MGDCKVPNTQRQEESNGEKREGTKKGTLALVTSILGTMGTMGALMGASRAN